MNKEAKHITLHNLPYNASIVFCSPKGKFESEEGSHEAGTYVPTSTCQSCPIGSCRSFETIINMTTGKMTKVYQAR